MMKWVLLGLAGGMMALSVAGCGGSAVEQNVVGGAEIKAITEDQRVVDGTIISLRPTVETMIISQGKELNQFNVVRVKWQRSTRFLMDGQPTDLTKVEQYMNVRAKGKMIEGQMVADEVRFSSLLPRNVKRVAESK